MFILRLCPILIFSAAFAAEPSPENFQIDRGDNLSSISNTLFGDSGYWPKVWGSHGQNAGLVNSGQSIQFLLGSEEAPPAFSISEADDSPDLISPPPVLRSTPSIRPAAATNHAAMAGDVVIPPPAVPPKPVLMQLPASFPQYQNLRGRKSNFKEYGVEILPRPKLDTEVRTIVPVYAQDDAVDSVGTYEASVGEQGLAFDGQEIFIKLKSGIGQIGNSYVLVHDYGALAQSPFSHAGDYHGHAVEVLAEVQIVAGADADKEGGYDHFRAKVIHSVGLSIKDGTAILPGHLTTISLSQIGSPSGIHASIIGGNYDSKGSVFGEGNWVFLDKGARDGVAIGQMVWTYSSPKSRDENSPFNVGIQHAALIKIGSVANDVSTGVVLSSSETMMQGDKVGESASAANPGEDMSAPANGGSDNMDNELENDSGTDEPGLGSEELDQM